MRWNEKGKKQRKGRGKNAERRGRRGEILLDSISPKKQKNRGRRKEKVSVWKADSATPSRGGIDLSLMNTFGWHATKAEELKC